MRPRHLALSELLALFVLLAIGAAIRYRLLGVTMTHVDDYGPLTQVLGAVKEGWSGWRIMGSIRDWTYAPGQFLITGLLLPLGRTFEDYVHLGRLVSWGFAVAGLLLLARACSRLSGPADFSLRAPVLLPVAIAALSLRGLIESSQAYNYAATLPVGVLLTLAFSSDRPVAILEGRHGAWRALLMGVLLGHSFWITYQAIFLVVAGFGALALERFARQPRQAWRELRGFLPAGFGVLLPLYHVYRFHLHLVKDRGLPGWEARLPTATLTDKIVFRA